MTDWIVRDYVPADETSWLRCRVLAFLDTNYYDDVVTAKPSRAPGLELVAVADDQVIGLLDASLTGTEATIETIAIHPDHRRLGIGRRLVTEICTRLQSQGATQLDAWTRDDKPTLAWYESQGFTQEFRYLHVYASTPGEAALAFNSPLNLRPRTGFFHGTVDHEDDVRRQFTRVHSCRRFVKPLA
ncbi:GNAT family N-acetyltransferase [Kribbella sp. NPDC026611]|uniref:GNAT family N-acetyltransferase n=1 Tax=Kribbella sp. NPDC026611 TaxID=3154911 RepID=UPI0033ED88B7